MSADCIKVVVKVRPVLGREAAEGLSPLWQLGPDWLQARCSGERYCVDAVFGPDSPPHDLYAQVAAPVVRAALNGINGTIFAYGQTASGKTHTMMGTQHSHGIIPLSIRHIFRYIEEQKDRDFLLRVSYIEIYNDKIRDLLDLNNTDLKIHEDLCGQVNVTSKEIVTPTPESILEAMRKGSQNRSVGGTLMNDASSRSHAIFQITVESRKHILPGCEDDESVNVSQLNLVDLAGSERASSSGDDRDRLREGSNINKSLTTLSIVIRQLSTQPQTEGYRYISYRDSKLTRILQSSLGGNAKTGIICAVTPTVLDETHSTLKFAMQAKIVKNKPVVNAVLSDATQLKMLTKQIKSLQKDIESKKNLEEHNLELMEKVKMLREQILMGISDPEVKQRSATLRRRTWCAAPNLKTIPENLETQNSIFQRQKFTSSIDASEDNDRNMYIRDSLISLDKSPVRENCPELILSEEPILIDDSDDEMRCSPKHECFNIQGTPPCKLRGRAKYVEKEFKELEEMTKLERLYVSKEYELKNEYKILNEDFGKLKEELITIKNKYKAAEKSQLQLTKEVEKLKCINIDLEFQLETSSINHKRREDDLISSLSEARNKLQSPNSLIQLPVIENTAKLNLSTKMEIFSFPDNPQECDKNDIGLASQIEALNFELKEKMEMNESLEILLAENNYFQDQLKTENSRLSLEIKHLNSMLEAPHASKEPQNISIKNISHHFEEKNVLKNITIKQLFDDTNKLDGEFNNYSNITQNLSNENESIEPEIILGEFKDENTQSNSEEISVETYSECDDLLIDNRKQNKVTEDIVINRDHDQSIILTEELNILCDFIKKIILKYGVNTEKDICDFVNKNDNNDIERLRYICKEISEIERNIDFTESKNLLPNMSADAIKLKHRFSTELNENANNIKKYNEKNNLNDSLKLNISTPKRRTLLNCHNIHNSFKEINKENISFSNIENLETSNVCNSPARDKTPKCLSKNNTPLIESNSKVLTPLKLNKSYNCFEISTESKSNIKEIESCNKYDINVEYFNKITALMSNINNQIDEINNTKDIDAFYCDLRVKDEYNLFCTFIKNIMTSIQTLQKNVLQCNDEYNGYSIIGDLISGVSHLINFVKYVISSNIFLNKHIETTTKSNNTSFTDVQLNAENIKINNENENLLLLISEFEYTLTNYEQYLREGCKNSEINDILNDKDVNTENDETNVYSSLNNLHIKAKDIISTHKSISSENKSFGNINNTTVIDDDKFTLSELLNKIHELTLDSEESQKLLLQYKSKQYADNAEFSLLVSELVAIEHYHKNLHNICYSTIKYLQENLNVLELFLQNLNEDQNKNKLRERNSSTTVDSFCNNTTVESSYFENSTVNNDTCDVSNISVDYKNMYDNAMTENNNLSEQLDAFTCKVKVLESENAILSSQIMDYIQEIEVLQTHVNKYKNNNTFKDIGLNTSLNNDTLLNKSIEKNDGVSNVECHFVFEKVKLISSQLLVNDIIEEILTLKTDLDKLLVLFKDVKDNAAVEIDGGKYVLNFPLAVKLIYSKNTDFINKLENINEEESQFIQLYKTCHDLLKLNKPCEDCEKQIKTLVESTDTSIEHSVPYIRISDDEISEKISMLESHLSCKENIITNLESEIMQLSLNLENQRSEFNKNVSTISEKLNNAVDQEVILKHGIDDLLEKNKTLLIDAERKDNKVVELSDELDKIKLENNRLCENIKLSDVKLNEILLNHKNDVDKCNESIHKYQLKISDFTERENNMKSQNDKDNDTIEMLQSKINSSKSAVDDLEKKLGMREADLNDINEKYNQVLKYLKTYNNKEIEYKNSIQQCQLLSVENDNLNMELEKYKTDNVSIHSEYNELKTELDKNKMDISLKEQEIHSLSIKLKTLENASLENENDIKFKLSLKNNELISITEKYEMDISNLNKKHSLIIDDFISLWKSIDSKKSDSVSEINDIVPSIRAWILECQKNLEIKSQSEHELSLKLNQFADVRGSLENQIIDMEKNISNLFEQNKQSLRENSEKINKSLMTLLGKTSSKSNLLFNKSCNFDDIVEEIENEIVCYKKDLETKDAQVTEISLNLEKEIHSNHTLKESLMQIEVKLDTSEKKYNLLNNQITELLNIVCSDVENLKSSSCMEEIYSNVNRIKCENQQLHGSVKNHEHHTKELKIELNDCKIAYENSNKEKQMYIKEIESKTHESKIYLSKIADLEAKIEEIMAQKESEPSVPHLGLMDYFVDKMTHELLQDKNEQLQKSNEDLRLKNKELIIDIRRLQHTLENSTLNLLPRDKENTTELKEQIKQLQTKISTLNNLKNDHNDLKVKYKELDEEYEGFLKVYKETEKNFREIYGEKKLLENRVTGLEMEISEMKDDQNDRRKKRQSLHDMNRGSLPSRDNSICDFQEKHTSFERICNANRITELEKENVLQKNNITELINKNLNLCNELKELQKTISNLSMSANNANIYDSKSTDISNTNHPRSVSNPTVGNGIVLDQKLHDYILENQRLVNINSKLKEVCRMRDKRIKDLEKLTNS